jgi:hypothetical protein
MAHKPWPFVVETFQVQRLVNADGKAAWPIGPTWCDVPMARRADEGEAHDLVRELANDYPGEALRVVPVRGRR